MGDTSLFDQDDASSRIGGNTKLLIKLLKSFLADTHFEKLNNAVNENNNTEAAHAAHALKGMGANLSLTALYKAMAEAEQQFKANNPSGVEMLQLTAIMEKTKKVVEEAVQALEA